MTDTIKIGAYWEPSHQKVGLYITGHNSKAEPITMIHKEDRFGYVEPCVSFNDKKELQSLLDDLWNMGLRPSARSDEYKAQLDTMKDHLNDMRAIVFKTGFIKREDLK